jgi:ElaB/YqjD/DUF883 family membrane-anchored ribosome-binding protein
VDNELEVIRHQMEEKRASLTDKLDALENQVMDTVHDATAEVSHIVEEVKSTVDSVSEGAQDVVQSVKDSLDLREHVRRNPWLALGGAVAVGVAGAYLLAPARRRYAEAFSPERSEPRRPQTNGFHGAAPGRVVEAPAAKQEEPSALVEAGKGALEVLKGLAVGTLMGVVREMVTPALPEAFKNDVSSMLNDFTTRIGGKLMPENFLGGEDRQDNAKGEEHEHGNQAEMGWSVGPAQRQDQEPVGQPDRRRADAGRRRL